MNDSSQLSPNSPISILEQRQIHLHETSQEKLNRELHLPHIQPTIRVYMMELQKV